MADLFSGSENVQITDRLPKWPPGKFVAKVTRAFAKETFGSGDMFFIEFAIVVSGNPASPPSGDEPAHCFKQSFSHNRAVAQAACAKVAAAILGYDTKDKARFDTEFRPRIPALLRAAQAESNPWCGLFVGVDSYVKPYTKKDGTHVPDNTDQRYFPTSYYEENGLVRPTIDQILARASGPSNPSPVWGAPPPPNTYAPGTVLPPGAPPYVAPPPPPVASPYPPDAIFHPAPGPLATHWRRPADTSWTEIRK